MRNVLNLKGSKAFRLQFLFLMAKESSNNPWHHQTNWYEYKRKSSTLSQRLADNLAQFIGSWNFIVIQSVIVVAWVAVNIYGYTQQWDPYPFILLNLLFSLQAAYTAPIIMMSQNRQSERDRIQAEADFKTNLEAKAEIEELQLAIARIEDIKLAQILDRLPPRRSKAK